MVLRALVVLGTQSLLLANTQNREFYYGAQASQVRLLEGVFYKKAVEQLPICCVDIFVHNPHENTYFLVLRKTEPAQGIWWYPGGRLFKGESFFDCARRKCHEEIGLSIEPVGVLGVYSTLFEKSAWDCSTHTINIVVCAQIANLRSIPLLDKNHTGYRWAPLNEVPQDPYVYQVYCEARAFLNI